MNFVLICVGVKGIDTSRLPTSFQLRKVHSIRCILVGHAQSELRFHKRRTRTQYWTTKLTWWMYRNSFYLWQCSRDQLHGVLIAAETKDFSSTKLTQQKLEASTQCLVTPVLLGEDEGECQNPHNSQDCFHTHVKRAFRWNKSFGAGLLPHVCHPPSGQLPISATRTGNHLPNC